jgi:hypothetical protein
VSAAEWSTCRCASSVREDRRWLAAGRRRHRHRIRASRRRQRTGVTAAAAAAANGRCSPFSAARKTREGWGGGILVPARVPVGPAHVVLLLYFFCFLF